jgi:hypothetical protein
MHDYPRKLFIKYLVAFMSNLRAQGYEVILAVDMSENSVDSKLNKALHQVGLIEAFCRKF